MVIFHSASCLPRDAKSDALNFRQDLVVIKEYPKSEIEHSFKNELEAYLSFQYPGNEHYVSEYFLEYYGSFKQKDKGFIILEFADEGSLLEFFKRNEMPRTREELLGFFENLSRLLSGLRLLHAQDFGKTNRQLRGVHEDLKPANIFVTRNEDGGTYKYNFKIGDFGLTSFSPTEANQIKSRDNKGGIMYNAPEMTNYDEFSRSVDEGINPLVDIWSFGCVLFEAAVWAISDERGREEFRILRCEENNDNRRLRDQGYAASFHNGTTKLNAVDEMLKRILEQRRAFDDITEGFCKLVLKHAMVPVRKPRYDANALWAVIQEYLDYARTPQTSWQASSPTGRTSLPDLDRGFRSRSFDDPRTPIDLSGQYRKSLNTSFLRGNRTVQKPFNHDMRIKEAETLDYQRFPSDLPEMAYPGNRQDFERGPILPPPIHGDPLSSNGNGKKDDSVKEISKHNESIKSQLAKGAISPPNNQTRYLKFRVPDVINWIKGGKKESDELYRCLSVALEKLKKRQQVCLMMRDTSKRLKSDSLFPKIFIIDDTAAMKKDHWPTVVDTFTALAHLTDEVDPDGIELYFRSSPESPKKLPRFLNRLMGADRLVDKVISQGTKQQDIIFDMEESVSKILDQVKKEISRKNPKTSIYILTDGIWGDATNSDNICGVDHAIRSLVGEMRRQNQMRSHISIQFIRFGDSEVAKSRLKYLDDDLAKESKS